MDYRFDWDLITLKGRLLETETDREALVRPGYLGPVINQHGKIGRTGARPGNEGLLTGSTTGKYSSLYESASELSNSDIVSFGMLTKRCVASADLFIILLLRLLPTGHTLC